MRARGSPADPVEASAASERLTGLGLRPSSGWVPEQPAVIQQTEVADPAPAPPPIHPSPAASAPSSVGELLRSAAAERAPIWAGGMIERATVGSVVTAVVVVLLIVIGGVMFIHRHSSSSGPLYSSSSYSGAAANSPAPDPVGSTATDASSIVVDVGGRVRKPGLVTLPAGARVADAIDAAGGPLRQRELNRIDLAQRVTDGQLLLVGVDTTTPAPSAATGASAATPAGPISLSTATIDELETLPGVGPVTAQKIIDWRTAHSGFTSVEQLQQVPGIGPAHYAEISPLVAP